MVLYQFQTVEDTVLWKQMCQESISVSTFMKYLHLLTKQTEIEFSACLPQKYGLIFDGFSTAAAHFLGTFASCTAPNRNGYQTELLGLSPMGDEISLDSIGNVCF